MGGDDGDDDFDGGEKNEAARKKNIVSDEKKSGFGQKRKFSAALTGLKFMRRARESTLSSSKNAGSFEETKDATVMESPSTSGRRRPLQHATEEATKNATTMNEERWTYETSEQCAAARKRRAVREHLAAKKKKRMHPHWVFGRQSFGGFNAAIEQLAREQEEKRLKAKGAVRAARQNAAASSKGKRDVVSSKTKNKKETKKRTTTTTPKR